MTPREAVALTGYLQAHFPSQPINEFTPDALAELLESYPMADCKRAVLNVADRGEEWCAPTAIKAEVKRIRTKRIDSHPPLDPPAGMTDAQELVWRREQNHRIANGETVEPTRAIGTRTYAELERGSRPLPAPPPVKREPDAATRDAKRAEIRRELHEGRRPVEVAEPLDDDDPEARPAVAELGSGCAA